MTPPRSAPHGSGANSAAPASSPFAAAVPPLAARAGFSSGFGVLAATLGSAVGLGNIWKFPYLTGANGGAGFLLV